MKETGGLNQETMRAAGAIDDIAFTASVRALQEALSRAQCGESSAVGPAHEDGPAPSAPVLRILRTGTPRKPSTGSPGRPRP